VADRKRTPLQHDPGFSLIEVLVVLIIVGILTGIAVPAYMNFQNTSNANDAKARLRAISRPIEDYYADYGAYNTSSPALTLSYLQSYYDHTLTTSNYSLPAADLSKSSYCVSTTVGGQTWSKTGTNGTPAQTACF
jgi:type IV pilus assembly protein PilE